MKLYLLFLPVILYTYIFTNDSPSLVHKALYSAILKLNANGQIEKFVESSKQIEDLAKLYNFSNIKDCCDTCNFLITLCPGFGKLNPEDHVLYCQSIEELSPCFFNEKPLEKVFINQYLYKSAFELCCFKKNHIEYENNWKQDALQSHTDNAQKCLKIKISASKSLFKLLRIISYILKIKKDSKDIQKLLTTVGNAIAKGVFKIFGSHKVVGEFLVTIGGMFQFIGQNQTAICETIGVMQMILTIIV